MGGQIEGHLADHAVTTIEQQSIADLAAQGRGLVHATGRSLGDGVLGTNLDPRDVWLR